MTREQQQVRFSAALIAIPFGVFFAAAAWAPLYEFWRFFFVIGHWPFHTPPEALDPTGRLMIAIIGGVGAGLGATIWAVATYVMPVAPREGRRAILIGAVTWFVTDSTFSIVAGSPMNAVVNIGLFAILVLPMLKGKNEQPA